MMQERLHNIFRIKSPRSIYLYSLLIGAVAGLGAIGFSYALAFAEHLTFDRLVGLPRSHPAGDPHFEYEQTVLFTRYLLLILPVVGGLLAGFIIHVFCPDAQGTGTDGMIQAFHNKEGRMKSSVAVFKSLATIVTLASGGSAGKEGPTAQIGASFGSALGGLIRCGAKARRTLLLAGTAGGLGAIFCAPFGGALTAVEVVYQDDIESDALVPCIISSVTAYLTYSGLTGAGSVFAVRNISFPHYYELPFYVILGLVCFFAGYAFIKVFNILGDYFARLSLPPILKPAVGGLVVGLIGFFLPEVIGTGFGFLQEVINGQPPIASSAGLLQMAAFFLLIAFLKIVTTSFTIGSGGSGGVFGPSLFIGGMLGGFTGSLAQYLFPGLEISISSFILVGMGAFFSGVASAPIAGMIMVCDMIGSYKLLPPLMIVSVVAFILSKRWSIYKGQVHTRFDSPAHYWDMNLDILDRMSIADHFTVFETNAVVPKNLSVSKLPDLALEIHASDFVVTNNDNSYYGMVSLRRIRMSDEVYSLKHLLTLADAADTAIPTVTPDDSLGHSLQAMIQSDMDKVAVTKNSRVLGHLNYSEILKVYHKQVRKSQPEAVRPPLKA